MLKSKHLHTLHAKQTETITKFIYELNKKTQEEHLNRFEIKSPSVLMHDPSFGHTDSK